MSLRYQSAFETKSFLSQWEIFYRQSPSLLLLLSDRISSALIVKFGCKRRSRPGGPRGERVGLVHDVKDLEDFGPWRSRLHVLFTWEGRRLRSLVDGWNKRFPFVLLCSDKSSPTVDESPILFLNLETLLLQCPLLLYFRSSTKSFFKILYD